MLRNDLMDELVQNLSRFHAWRKRGGMANDTRWRYAWALRISTDTGAMNADKRGNSDAENAQEARRILERVNRDSAAIGGSFMARMAGRTRNHFSGADKPADDPVEVWGTRIGRAIGLVAFIAILGLFLWTITA